MRLFFHLNECGTVTRDDEGREVADIATAREAAIREAREIMCAEVSDGRLCLGCGIEIADADGAPVMTVHFRDAVTISGLPD